MGNLKINLNDKVRFKLTDAGFVTLLNYRHAYPYNLNGKGVIQIQEELETELDKTDGVMEMLMHEFMHTFGPQLINGNRNQIVDNQLEIIADD